MKKSLALCIAAILMLVSACKKKDFEPKNTASTPSPGTTPSTTTQGCRISFAELYWQKFNCRYDDKGRLIKFANATYSYSGSTIVKSDPDEEQTSTLTLDNQGRVTSAVTSGYDINNGTQKQPITAIIRFLIPPRGI